MTTLELTGERTVPGIPRENYWFRRHVAAYRFARRHVRGRVLDAGCGEGYGTANLGRRGRRAFGVDADEAIVRHAAGTYRRSPFLVGDLERLPVRRSALDGIVALQVVEHLSAPHAFLDGCVRALVPTGTLVLTTPNRATFPAGLNPWHPREYDAAELRGVLAPYFDHVAIAGIEHGPALTAVDRILGEPVQHRLVAARWDELPRAVRAALRAVSASAFRITDAAETALDLVAICHRPR